MKKKKLEWKWMRNQCRGSFLYLIGLSGLSVAMSVCYILITMIFQGFMNIAAGDSSVTLPQMFLFSAVAIFFYAASQIISSVLGGTVLNRLTSDVTNVIRFVTQLFGQLWLVVFTALFAIIYLFSLNWKMAILYLTIIPLLFLAISRISPKLQEAAEEDSANEDNNRKHMQEILNRLNLFQAYEMKESSQKNWDELYRRKKKSKIRLSLLQGEFGFLNTMMTFTIFILSGGIGAYFVLNGNNKVGDLVAMIQLSNYIILPLTEGSQWMNKYNSAVVSVRRIRELEDLKERDRKEALPEGHGKIHSLKVDKLSFAYKESGDCVLDGVSAEFRKGEITGIIGASGSGKTTLLNLILGLFPLQEKSMIRIETEEKSLCFDGGREAVSYVPSDNFVFYGTVRENVCMSLPYEEKKFWESCRLANIDGLIRSFKEKENEWIQEDGSNLSVGQKQRIALARALYNGADIIVFDEPTANLDKASCEVFRKMIRAISKDKICIIVTHDKDMMGTCDRVYELKDKRLVLGSQ